MDDWDELDEFDDIEEWGDDDGDYDLGPGDWLEDLEQLPDLIPLLSERGEVGATIRL